MGDGDTGEGATSNPAFDGHRHRGCMSTTEQNVAFPFFNARHDKETDGQAGLHGPEGR